MIYYIRKLLLILLGSITSLESFSYINVNQPVPASTPDSAQILIGLSNQYINKGDYQNALSVVKELHRIRQKMYSSDDPRIITSYTNIAYVFNLMSAYDSAQHYLSIAERLYETKQIPEGIELGNLYSTMGLIYKFQGDYLHAETCYLRAEEYLQTSTESNIKDMIILYLRFADVERMLEKYKESLQYLQKSYKLIPKVTDNLSLAIIYYTGSAIAYSKMNTQNKSIELQLKAIRLAKSDSANNAIRLAVLYNNLGLDYLKIDQLLLAGHFLDMALSIYQTIGYRGTYLTQNLESLGNLYDKKQNYIKALEYNRQALQLVSDNFKSPDLLTNPSKDSIFPSPLALTILHSKSVCLNNYYNQQPDIKYLDVAIQTSLLAIEIIAELRNTYQSYESKMQIAEHEYSIFKLATHLLEIAFNKTGERKYSQLAFIVSEKSKSAVLLSSLREINAREFGDIPDSLLIEEQSLSKNISLYRNTIYEENQNNNPDQNKLNTWNRCLFEAQQKHNKIIQLFELNYPKYYALKYDNAVTDIEELQRQLPQNTSVLEYVLNDSVLNIFVISNRSFSFHTQAIDSSFYKLLSEYMDGFHKFDFSRQSYNNYIQFCWNSKSLYDILITPILNHISGRNLLIVPDGPLSYLPFETLISNLPNDRPSDYYRSLNYLLYDYNISYAYSSTLFCQVSRDKSRKPVTRLLAFAPEYSPELDVNSFRTQFVTRQKFRKELYPIPGIIEEVNAIKNLIPSDIYIGCDATESNFKKVSEHYDILHLAMHAIIDDNNPLYSKLIFTLENDTEQDGLLNTYEIFGLKLSARMVVLSACSTGEGDYSKGEGVISLARGFVYAGSPSLVMSMWQVEDKSGSVIMKWFYENLLKGESKAEALRNAKIRYLKEARPENIHPFFWSSFLVMGNTQPLYRRHIGLIPAGIVAAIGILAFFVGFRRIRKSRKVKSS